MSAAGRVAAGSAPAVADDAAPGGVSVECRGLSIDVPTDDGPKLRAEMHFDAPEGTGTHDLVLFDDAILEHVVTHRTVVSVRRDFALGKIDDAPEIVGITLFSQKSVTIRRENASALRGFGATVLAGVRHIAEGKDHLLFVVILLKIGEDANYEFIYFQF